eukprot:g10982.t1
MVLSIVAAVVVVVLFGAGPVLIDTGCQRESDAREHGVPCGSPKCDVEQVQAEMRRKKMPKELKVEIEGQLYSVPDDAEMVVRTPKAVKAKWWKRFSKKDRSLSGTVGDGAASDKAKRSGSDAATTTGDDGGEAAAAAAAAGKKTLQSAGENSCQICFGQKYSTVMLPCGHGGLCWDCGVQIYALTQECPMCRAKVELLVPLDSGARRYEGKDEFVSSANYGEDGKPSVTSSSTAALTCTGRI